MISMTPMTDSERSGDNQVTLGAGSVNACGVFLQGFYMSYIDTDRNVNGVVASTSLVAVSESNGQQVAKYSFRCEMRETEEKVTPENRLLTVVIADFVPEQR